MENYTLAALTSNGAIALMGHVSACMCGRVWDVCGGKVREFYYVFCECFN